MLDLRTMALGLGITLAVGCGSAPPPSADNAPASQSGEPAAASTATSDADPGTPQGAATSAPSSPPVVEDKALGGQLSQQDIHAIVVKHGELFDQCYSLGAGKSKSFVATVTIKATIGPSGTVNEAKVIKSTAKNAKVDACVADAFKKMQFPSPKDGATSVITFPMEFAGVEQVQ